VEKKFDPTQKKLQELRKKGQVSRGKVLNRAVSVMVSFVVLLLIVSSRLGSIRNWSVACLKGDCGNPLNAIVDSGMLVFGPIAATIVVTCFLDLWASNWLLGKEGRGISFSNLNPIEGVKGIWTRIKGIPFYVSSCWIFLFALSVTTWNVIVRWCAALTTAYDGVVQSLIYDTYNVIGRGAGVGIALGLLDYMRERFLFKRKNRMSFQELKDEYKKDEGDPHMKALRRGIYEEIMLANLEMRVKKSEFILIERNL